MVVAAPDPQPDETAVELAATGWSRFLSPKTTTPGRHRNIRMHHHNRNLLQTILNLMTFSSRLFFCRVVYVLCEGADENSPDGQADPAVQRQVDGQQRDHQLMLAASLDSHPSLAPAVMIAACRTDRIPVGTASTTTGPKPPTAFLRSVAQSRASQVDLRKAECTRFDQY